MNMRDYLTLLLDTN